MRVFCNKCDVERTKGSLNELEKEEFDKCGSFVCSTCINEEMDNEKGICPVCKDSPEKRNYCLSCDREEEEVQE